MLPVKVCINNSKYDVEVLLKNFTRVWITSVRMSPVYERLHWLGIGSWKNYLISHVEPAGRMPLYPSIDINFNSISIYNLAQESLFIHHNISVYMLPLKSVHGSQCWVCDNFYPGPDSFILQNLDQLHCTALFSINIPVSYDCFRPWNMLASTEVQSSSFKM